MPADAIIEARDSGLKVAFEDMFEDMLLQAIK